MNITLWTVSSFSSLSFYLTRGFCASFHRPWFLEKSVAPTFFSAALPFLFSFKPCNQQHSRFALCSFCIFVYACLRIVPAYFHIVRSQFSFTLFLRQKWKKDKSHLNEIYLFFRLSTAFCKSLRNRVPSSFGYLCRICIS